MLMTDINGAEIPVLVDEEVNGIDTMEHCGNHDSVGDVAMKLILVGDEGEITVNMLASCSQGFQIEVIMGSRISVQNSC